MNPYPPDPFHNGFGNNYRPPYSRNCYKTVFGKIHPEVDQCGRWTFICYFKFIASFHIMSEGYFENLHLISSECFIILLIYFQRNIDRNRQTSDGLSQIPTYVTHHLTLVPNSIQVYRYQFFHGILYFSTR